MIAEAARNEDPANRPAPGSEGAAEGRGSLVQPASRERRIALAALAAVLAIAIPCYAGPVGDIDVWWHLAAGRWIVEHGQLPDVDPFGVFGTGNPVRTATILKGQWLGQVALFAAMAGAGPLGVVLTRAGALALAVALVFLRARRLGGDVGTAVVASAVSATALLGFPGERPQLFAFAMAGAVLLLVEEWERGRVWALAGIAAAGVVWTNLHGSVLIAVAVLALSATVEAVRALAGARATSARRLAAAAAALAAATLAAPNGLTTYRYVLETQGGELAKRTTEYVSSLRIHTAGGWAPEALVVGFFVLAAAGLWPLARTAPHRAVGTAFLAAASAVSYRYHAFFVVLACPWLVVAIWSRHEARFARRGKLLAGVAAGALAGAVVGSAGGPLGALREPVAQSTVPAAAAAQLRASGVTGRALVWFGWAGYLLWDAWPGVTPVVDPRMLDDGALAPYTHMIWATPDGVGRLEAEDLSAVLLPFQSPTGDVYALHGHLRSRADWTVEYVWAGGVLYRRVR